MTFFKVLCPTIAWGGEERESSGMTTPWIMTLGISCVKTFYWMGSSWPLISLWMGETS